MSLVFREITRRVGSVTLVDRVSFSVEAGELVVVIGKRAKDVEEAEALQQLAQGATQAAETRRELARLANIEVKRGRGDKSSD